MKSEHFSVLSLARKHTHTPHGQWGQYFRLSTHPENEIRKYIAVEEVGAARLSRFTCVIRRESGMLSVNRLIIGEERSGGSIGGRQCDRNRKW